MKNEFLKELGLEDEVIQKIQAEAGKDVTKAKAEAEPVKTELLETKKQLEAANAEIEKFKTLDVEGIKKAADEWKVKASEWEEKAKETEKETDKKIAEMEFDSLLKDKLSGHSFSSEYAKKGIFDEIKGKGLKVENGKILGFDDVFNAIKESQPSAFKNETKPKVDLGKQHNEGDVKKSDFNATMNNLIRGKGDGADG